MKHVLKHYVRTLSIQRFFLASRKLMSFLFLLLCIVFSPLPVPAEAQRVAVGVYENAPKIFTTDQGHPSGIFIDIIEYIAKKEGWDLKYVHGTWAEGLDRLEKGEIDLMPDVAFTAERGKRFSFHKEQVISSWFQVYVRKDSNIHSILDLDGKRISVLDKSIQQSAFERLSRSFGLKVFLIPAPDYKTVFKLVASRDADGGITNQYYGTMHAKQYSLVDSAVVFEPSSLYFAATKNRHKELLHAIDENLIEMKKDPQSIYFSSLKHWTSEEIPFRLPDWLRILGLGAGAALLISLGGSIILKRQVNARTRELREINREMEERVAERTAELVKANEELSIRIEEREKADRALMTSEKKYRDLVESANSVILRWKPDGSVTFFNAYAQNFFGYTGEEIIGKNIIGTIVPEIETSGRDLASRINNVARDTERYKFNENENICKNGKKVWIAWTNKPVFDEDGTLTEILSVGNDITDRKNIEESLKKTFDELAIAKEQAEAADHIKSAFLATMSHELRTPLNSIIGFSGIILQELAGPLNEEQKKQMNMVRSSARHLLSLINDVLDISKIESGQLEVYAEPFTIQTVLDNVVSTMKPLADKKGLSLNANIDTNVEEVVADQRRVEQVLLNLISNAVKYTEQGEVAIDVSMKRDYSFTVAGSEKPFTVDAVLFRVSDTGIGIAHDEMTDLFQPFRQIDTGLTRKSEGTGLGLAICRRLSRLMGGDVTVESEWGRGSTFTFFLPLRGGDDT